MYALITCASLIVLLVKKVETTLNIAIAQWTLSVVLITALIMDASLRTGLSILRWMEVSARLMLNVPQVIAVPVFVPQPVPISKFQALIVMGVIAALTQNAF